MFRPRATKRAGPKDGLDPCGKPYTLAELGLFIDEDDSVRIIAQPTERYQYKMKRADRDLKSSDAEDYNDRFWLATSNALSIIVCERLERYGLIRQLVPLGSSADDPHTCIYTSPHDLARPELTVIFTDGGELGVWTGRLVSQRSVRCGSLEYFVHLLVQDGRDIIIANPTQIIWNAELKVAMTRHQFICSGGRRLGKATQIPQMKTQAEHVNYVMHSVVAQSMSTKISIVAAGFSALALIQYLDEYWSMWQGKLSAIAFLSSCHSREDISNESLQSFMTLKCVNFCASDLVLHTALEDDRFGVQCVSGGHGMPEQLPCSCIESCLSFIQSIERGVRPIYLNDIQQSVTTAPLDESKDLPDL